MPMNFASKATAPRMRSASAAIVCSRSGRATNRASVVLVEPALQHHLCGDRIASGLPLFPMHAGARELGIRCHRGETLVDAIHGESEARLELAGEPICARGHLVLA